MKTARENEKAYIVVHDPIGTAVKMVEKLCRDTGLNLESVLSKFPDFNSIPIRERLLSTKRTQDSFTVRKYGRLL